MDEKMKFVLFVAGAVILGLGLGYLATTQMGISGQAFEGMTNNMPGYEIVYGSCSTHNGLSLCIADCPTGKTVIGGGCTQAVTASNTGALLSSAPVHLPSYRDNWTCYFRSGNVPNVLAICVNS